MFDKLNDLFGKNDKDLEKQKKRFKEKLEKLKKEGFDNEIVVDKSDLSGNMDNAMMNSFWLGYEMAEEDSETGSNLEQLVFINLAMTGVLLLIKLAPMLGLAG